MYDSSVQLRCSAKGLPAPDVVWTRNGLVLMKAKSTATLELKNVTKHHEGTYTCAVNNTQGSENASVEIEVVGG